MIVYIDDILIIQGDRQGSHSGIRLPAREARVHYKRAKVAHTTDTDHSLETDASTVGWGATCQGIQIETRLHINCI